MWRFFLNKLNTLANKEYTVSGCKLCTKMRFYRIFMTSLTIFYEDIAVYYIITEREGISLASNSRKWTFIEIDNTRVITILVLFYVKNIPHKLIVKPGLMVCVHNEIIFSCVQFFLIRSVAIIKSSLIINKSLN